MVTGCSQVLSEVLPEFLMETAKTCTVKVVLKIRQFVTLIEDVIGA